ncbi:hypothetical protein, partial [Escherichia coli]
QSSASSLSSGEYLPGSLQGKISSDGCLKKEQMVVSAIASTPHALNDKNIAFYILMQIVSEYIALLQDDVDPKNATEERHCCWQIEEVSGFVTPEKRSPAIIAGGAVQLIIVCL